MFALVLVVLLVGPSSARETGRSAARFLMMGPGARPAAMGGAYTAIADDAHALYWNPAGLARMPAKAGEVQFMHSEWFAGINYEYLGYVHQYPLYDGKWGASVTMLDYGSINVTQIAGQLPITGLGSTDARDFAGALSYGQHAPLVDWGFTVKYVEEKIEVVRASAFALDAGILLNNPPLDHLELGLVMMNLGSRPQYDLERENLPLTFKLGGAYRPYGGAWLLSADLVAPNDDKVHGAFGLEWQMARMFALRLGYTTENNAGSGITAGLGFSYEDYLNIDYAYVPYGDLGNTHRISVDYLFGNIPEVPEEGAAVTQPQRGPIEIYPPAEQRRQQLPQQYGPAVRQSPIPAVPQPPARQQNRTAPVVPVRRSEPVQAAPTATEYIIAGNRYFQAGDMNAATANYSAALQQDEHNLTALYNLATIYYRQSDYRRAADYYVQLVRIDNNHRNAHLYLGGCFEQLGQIDYALLEWELVLRLDPGNQNARMMIEKYRR